MTLPDGAPLLHLPVVYAVALALRDAGLPVAEIAERLELSPASIPTLLEIADAKLSSLRLAAGAQTGTTTGATTDSTTRNPGYGTNVNRTTANSTGRSAKPAPDSAAEPQGSRTE